MEVGAKTGEWGSLLNPCGNLGVGSQISVALNFTQTGGTITGQIDLDVFGFSQSLTTFTTTVVAGGGLVFQATHQNLTTRITQDWQLNIQVGQLFGTAIQTSTDTGP